MVVPVPGVLVPAADVMAAYKPTTESWQDLIDWYLATPWEAERIAMLREELARGPSTEPVAVLPDEMSMRNGQHRVVAAFLSGGCVELTVYPEPEEDIECDLWTCIISVPIAQIDFEPYQSLRLADGRWVEPTGAFCPSQQVWAMEYAMEPGTDPALLSDAYARFLARHWQGTLLDVYPTPEPWVYPIWPG